MDGKQTPRHQDSSVEIESQNQRDHLFKIVTSPPRVTSRGLCTQGIVKSYVCMGECHEGYPLLVLLSHRLYTKSILEDAYVQGCLACLMMRLSGSPRGQVNGIWRTGLHESSKSQTEDDGNWSRRKIYQHDRRDQDCLTM